MNPYDQAQLEALREQNAYGGGLTHGHGQALLAELEGMARGEKPLVDEND